MRGLSIVFAVAAIGWSVIECHAANNHTSIRLAQTVCVCQLGLAMYALHPLPPSLHAVSLQPRDSRAKVVASVP